MTFLITGGAGFIGSNYLHRMVKSHPEDRFVCLDALTYAGNRKNIIDLEGKKNFLFVHGDIRDRKTVFSLFEKERFDKVVNFAAESHVDRSIDEPEVFLSTNVLGVLILLEASRHFNIRRFHQVSTDEVYGDTPIDSSYCFTEKDDLHPSSPYAASKASADLLALSYVRTYDMDITISRGSDTYGPYQFPEKLIPLMISHIRKGESLPLHGNGKNIRDWLYVEDHCLAIDTILEKGREGEIYNVAGKSEKSNLEIVETLQSKLHSQVPIQFIQDRPGHDRRYGMSTKKIETELGFERKWTFEEGIEKTISWYLENEAWQKEIETREYPQGKERYK